MNLSELKHRSRANRDRRRKGRGTGSGRGDTCGKGTKGYQSRSGARRRIFDEGGKTPFYRHIPKRGFKSLDRGEVSIVNVAALNRFEDGQEVTPELLKQGGLVRQAKQVKVLGAGQLKRRLTIRAHSFSKSAVEKIEAAGGTATPIS